MFARILTVVSVLVLVVGLSACAKENTKSPDVSVDIRTALDSAGLKDVSVSQDRDKGIVALGGTSRQREGPSVTTFLGACAG